MISQPLVKLELEFESLKVALNANRNHHHWGEKLDTFIKKYIVENSKHPEKRKIAHQSLIELFKIVLNTKNKSNIYHFIHILSETWSFGEGFSLLNEQINEKALPEILNIVAEHWDKDVVEFVTNALGHRMTDPKMIGEFIKPWLLKLKSQPELALYWFPNRENHVQYRFEVFKILFASASQELKSKLLRSEQFYGLVIDLIAKEDDKRLAELIQIDPNMSFHFEVNQSEEDLQSSGISPLQLAIERNNAVIVNRLLNHDPSLAKSILKRFIAANNIKGLHKALSYELIRLCINVADTKGYTPLHFAAQRGRADMVNELIVHKAGLNLTTKSGATPLHKALMHHTTNPERALATVDTLMNNCSDITILNKSGNHLLNLAIRFQAWDIALRLLQSEFCKVLVNKSDEKGRNPLHYVLERLKSGPLPPAARKVYQTLLKLNGNIVKLDKQRITPLHYLALSDLPEDEKHFLSLFARLDQNEKLKLLLKPVKDNSHCLFCDLLTQKRGEPFFRAIFKQLRPEQIFALISNTSGKDYSIFQYMIVHHRLDLIKMVMEPLSEEQRKSLILQEKTEISPLRLALQASKDANHSVNPQSQKIEMPLFFYLLNLLPKEEQALAIHCPDNTERGALTLLHSSKEFHEYFKLVAAHFGLNMSLDSHDFDRIFPQFSVQLMAQVICDTKQLTDQLERLQFERLKEMKESSMDRSITEAANDQFDKVVRPYLREQFNRMGAHYTERLVNVETNIRRTLLENIKLELLNELMIAKAKKQEKEQKVILEKIAFIDKHLLDKNQSLCKGDAKLMEEARKLFTSNELTAQIAWRCYDRKCKTYLWDNLFVKHRQSDRMVVGNVDIEAEDNQITLGLACDIVRERAAYYYLAAMDNTYPEIRQDSIQCFIHYLAEIRRAHNAEIPVGKNRKNYDDPSCFPGHITRLAQMADNHPKLRLTLRKGKRKLVTEKVNNLVVDHFRKTIQGKSKENVLALFNAITMMNDHNAEELRRAPKPAVYQGEWCQLRENFMHELTENSINTIIPSINQYLVDNNQQVLSEAEYVYVEFALLNLSGEGLIERLVKICESVGAIDKAKVEPEKKGQLEAQPTSIQSILDDNPFSIRTLFPKETDDRTKEMVIRKDKEKHLAYQFLVPEIFKYISIRVKEKSDQMDLTSSFTQALIVQIFATEAKLEPQKRILIALQELKGSAEYGYLVPDDKNIESFVTGLTSLIVLSLEQSLLQPSKPETGKSAVFAEAKVQKEAQKGKSKTDLKQRSEFAGLSLDTTYSPRYNSLRAGLNNSGSNSGSTPGSKEKEGDRANKSPDKAAHFTFRLGAGSDKASVR